MEGLDSKTRLNVQSKGIPIFFNRAPFQKDPSLILLNYNIEKIIPRAAKSSLASVNSPSSIPSPTYLQSPNCQSCLAKFYIKWKRLFKFANEQIQPFSISFGLNLLE